MVIYGYNSTFLGGEQLKSATCPECGTQGSMEMGVWRRHAHVFWIPMFPIGKYGVVACTHCNAKFEKKKEIPETVRRDFDQFKSQARGPLWQFSGLGIIAIIVVAVSITSAQNTKRDKAYIAEPIEGDIYNYEPEDGFYSNMKVMLVDTDTIYLSQNNLMTNKKSGVKELDKPENYDSLIYGYPKSDLRQMYEDGTIYEVDRKE